MRPMIKIYYDQPIIFQPVPALFISIQVLTIIRKIQSSTNIHMDAKFDWIWLILKIDFSQNFRPGEFPYDNWLFALSCHANYYYTVLISYFTLLDAL